MILENWLSLVKQSLSPILLKFQTEKANFKQQGLLKQELSSISYCFAYIFGMISHILTILLGFFVLECLIVALNDDLFTSKVITTRIVMKNMTLCVNLVKMLTAMHDDDENWGANGYA